jgi:hypothetical protein
MCAVGRVCENDDVVVVGVFEEFNGVMGAMAIEEEYAGASLCLLFSLSIEISNPW